MNNVYIFTVGAVIGVLYGAYFGIFGVVEPDRETFILVETWGGELIGNEKEMFITHGMANAIRKCTAGDGEVSVDSWGDIACYAESGNYDYRDFQWVTERELETIEGRTLR